jgi:hypothetical protein
VVGSPQKLGGLWFSGFSSSAGVGGVDRLTVRAVTHASGAEPMSTFEAPYLLRETGVDAALAGTAATGQARPATSCCCVIGGPKGADQAARAHRPLRERR